MTETAAAPEAAERNGDEEVHRIPGTPDQRQDAKDRASACGDAILAVLREHNCQITAVPTLSVEPVGRGSTRAMAEAMATWYIEPLPNSEEG